MKTRIGFCGLLLMSAFVQLGADEPIIVKVSPAVSMAPANVVIHAQIESNPGNRAIEIVADSENFYRSSIIPLDGAAAPRINVIELRGLPGGKYEVTAVLIGTDGRPRASQRRSVNILAEAAR
jgi:hypothetical protein